MVADIGIGDVVVGTCGPDQGKYYRLLAFGEHTTTGEREAIYQALYPPFGTFVRPESEFLERTPQGYRFEVMTVTELANLASKIRQKEEGDRIFKEWSDRTFGKGDTNHAFNDKT